jgi:Zn-finger nucleic acid-binding protein
LCPTCGTILIRFKVSHEIDFSLDRCGKCGGIWFDSKEWEILKSHGWHDDIHRIFSRPWQAEILRQEHQKNRERILIEKFGMEDLAEVRRIKSWLNNHPHKQELYAFLTNPET